MLKYKIPQIVTLTPIQRMIFYRMGKQFPITKNSETLLKSSFGVLFFEVPGRFELPYTVLQTAD